MTRFTSLALVLAVVTSLTLTAPHPAAGNAQLRPPNIIVIMTDDQRLELFTPEYMPRVFKRMVDVGFTTNNAVANIPNCCPARATFYTGLLPRNHTVWTNKAHRDPNLAGGHAKFKRRYEDTGQWLPVWLQQAGYTTAFFGKHLNGYPANGDPFYVPAGWDEWYGMAYVKGADTDTVPNIDNQRYKRYWNHDFIVKNKRSDIRYVKYRTADPYDTPRGTVRRYDENWARTSKTANATTYMTDVLQSRATSFIRRKAGAKPFFAYVSFYAPHLGAWPHAVHADNVVDVCALVPELADRMHEDHPDFAVPRVFWEEGCNSSMTFDGQPAGRDPNRIIFNQVMAVKRIDRAVSKILDVVEKAGEIDNTYVVFLSDQGMTWGERGMIGTKKYPYSEAVRIPFAVIGPGIQIHRSTEVISTVDLAPTILSWAGTQQDDHAFDGGDLSGLFAGSARHINDFVIIEGPSRKPGGYWTVPAWWSLFSAQEHEIFFADGTYERFDLRTDPHETHNLGRRS